ncbi:LysR family transcriptional regulator [Agrobacterium sp. T29]|uniref:LysR family transcriptional regulator n=1 Tax=Agrobacterium sp. T29 TaxID=2580515 RepID=UPI00115E70C5|nr:LysR family transcriptional regulator [Agrobacterium sp. T29]
MDEQKSLHDLLSLRELEVFVAFGETGSISAASRRSGISQSAASQLIQRLEQRMGLALLDRSARPLRLTLDGHDVMCRAENLLTEAKQFVNSFDEVGPPRSVFLRIGVVETLCLPFIPKLVEALGNRLDRLSVMVASSNKQREAFLERRIDVMIMSDAMDDLAELKSHVVAEEPFILIVPRGRVVKDIADLRSLAAELPMVRFGHQSAARVNIDAQLKRTRVPIIRDIEIDTPHVVIGMVAAGLGWTITTPLSARSAWQDPEDVELLPFPGAQFRRKLYLATRRNELGKLPEELARHTKNILREHYLSGITEKQQWLASEIKIPD